MRSSTNIEFSRDIERRYQDNVARHILSISLYMQSEIMGALTVSHGHSQLRINFEPYISMAARSGVRLSEIAEMLGISRQAAKQTANQIEKAGSLLRASDPSDGRAKLLVTTPRAMMLVKQGAAEALALENQFAELVGEGNIAQLNLSMTKLSRRLGLLFPYQGEQALTLAATLPRMSDYITRRLQQLTMQKGHPQLKRSFGTVLTAIGPRGGRIQQMARSRDISKQAVSAIATELEALGYIERVADAADARQIVLQFTKAGRALIADSVDSVNQLVAEFAEAIGDGELEHLKHTVAKIYRLQHLEEDIFGNASGNDIQAMAQQLSMQMGEQGAINLGRLLLAGNSGH